jgi:hypothetical protein
MDPTKMWPHWPNPPDEASDIAASLHRLGLGERHPAL